MWSGYFHPVLWEGPGRQPHPSAKSFTEAVSSKAFVFGIFFFVLNLFLFLIYLRERGSEHEWRWGAEGGGGSLLSRGPKLGQPRTPRS